MLKDIKKTTKHTSVYALGNIAAKVVGFILLPIYTNEAFLSQDDLGSLAILEATAQILTAILTFAISNSLVRWYWDNKYRENQKSIVFTIFLFLFTVNVPFVSWMVFKASLFSELIFGSSQYIYLLRLTFLAIFCRIFNLLISQLLQLQSRSGLYTSLQVGKLIVVLGLTVLAVTRFNRGLDGIWEASLIGEIIVLLITVPYIIKNINFSFEWDIFKEMFAYSYPLVISNLAVVTLTVMDRFMLHYIVGLSATGVYSLGLRLSNTLKIVITDSVLAALAPLRMQKINEPNNQRFFAKVLTYTSFVFLLALLVLSLFSFELIHLITATEEYWEAGSIIGILSFAFLFSLARMNFVTGLMITKKTKILGLLIFITAALNFILNYLFIPYWGFYGAAMATLFSQFIFMSLTYIAAQRVYTIPYEIRKIGIAVIIAIFIVYAGILANSCALILRLTIKFSMLVAYPFVLLLFNFYETVELENIKQILKSVGNFTKMKQGFKNFLK